jgi:hypothetical protein
MAVVRLHQAITDEDTGHREDLGCTVMVCKVCRLTVVLYYL